MDSNIVSDLDVRCLDLTTPIKHYITENKINESICTEIDVVMKQCILKIYPT